MIYINYGSVAAWYPKKGDDEIENVHAEQSRIYISLWPQTLFALAMILFKLKEMDHYKDAERILKRMEKKVSEITNK